MRLRSFTLPVVWLGLGACASAQTSADLFDDSVLHEIRITLKDSEWANLQAHYLDNTYGQVDSLTWNGLKSASITNFQMRNRGHGSRSKVKPSLHIDFNRSVKDQLFLGLTSLDLKNNSQDPSLLHERMSMALFRRMGIVASREASVKLYVNDQYLGVYNLVEPPDQVMLKRVYGENNGYLYEYRPGDWAGPGLGYHFEYLGDDLDKYAPEPFDPQTHTLAPDTVTLEGMIRTINQAPDSSFISSLSAYLDPKQWLRFIAVETFVADFDCVLGDVFGMNNFFLYRFENKKFSEFIAWDKDNAFAWAERPIMQNSQQNVLMRRLMAIPEYRNAYIEAVVQCAIIAGGQGGWLEREADRAYQQIREAALADTGKSYLDSGNLLPASNQQFEDGVTALKSFAATRTPFVLTQASDQGYQFPSSGPTVSQGGMVSAAPYAQAAAGSLGSIYGSNFGVASNTSVYINGYEAPVIAASPQQVNVQVPWEAAGSATVAVIVNGVTGGVTTGSVLPQAPGVLFGATYTTVHYASGALVSTTDPAVAGERLIVYCTGLGPVSGPMTTGQPASSTSLQPTTQTVTVTIDGVAATVEFAGLAPGFLGLYQVNLVVPSRSNAGPQSSMIIRVGGASSPATPLPSR
jgi:uncharacterized protein (TIGR03437 family)